MAGQTQWEKWKGIGQFARLMVFILILIQCAMSGPSSVSADDTGAQPTPNSESTWRELITMSITSPDPVPVLYVNEQMDVVATATCEDQFSNDGGTTWNNYAADTESPAPSVTWSCIYGSFTSTSGFSTTYTAPGASVVVTQITDTITATASAYANDIYGVPPVLQQAAPINPNVVLIQTSINTGAHTAGAYAAPFPQSHGGIAPNFTAATLGWLPMSAGGNPITGFYVSTEIKGDPVNNGLVFNNFTWNQSLNNYLATAQNNNPLGALNQQNPPGTADYTENVIQHGPPGHHVFTNNNPWPMYVWDCPGLPVVGNGNIAALTEIESETYFETWVVDGNGLQISNTTYWKVEFDIKLVGGVWTSQWDNFW